MEVSSITLQPFPERTFSSKWCSYTIATALLEGQAQGRVGTFLRRSKRAQGDGRDDGRWFVVLVKDNVNPDSIFRIQDIEEVLYMQCQCSRHHGAMLTPEDFFKGMEPWKKFTEPKHKAGQVFWDHFKNLGVKDQKVPAPDRT